MPNDTPQESGRPDPSDDDRRRARYEIIGITIFTIVGAVAGWMGTGVLLLFIIFIEIAVVGDEIMDRRLMDYSLIVGPVLGAICGANLGTYVTGRYRRR